MLESTTADELELNVLDGAELLDKEETDELRLVTLEALEETVDVPA